MREVGQQFSVRGVEATVEGELVRDGERLRLRLDGTGEALDLAPLRRKVQWDARARRAEPLTAAERAAYARLLGPRGPSRRVRLVGPLDPPAQSGPAPRPYTLEVRQFRWLP